MVNSQDLLFFMRQLSALLSGGVNLAQSLSLLAQAQEKKTIRQWIHQLRTELNQGKSFQQALQRFPAGMDALSYNLIRLGEHTGKLELMLKRAAEVLAKKQALRQTLKQALAYPALLSIAALITSFILLIFIVPHFAALFESHSHPLPLLTRLVIQLSLWLRQAGLSLVFLILGLLVVLIVFTRSRKTWQGFWFNLPYVKSLYKKMSLLTFTQNLATSLSASIPLSEALLLVCGLTAHIGTRKSIQSLYAGLMSGKRFYACLAETRFYPPLLVQMIRTGEESGTLEQMLEQLAILYEGELQAHFHTLGRLLEPLIISILGVLIGGVVISMYLPLFQLGTALS